MFNWQIEIDRLVKQGWDKQEATNYVKMLVNDRWTLDTFLDAQQELDDFILEKKLKMQNIDGFTHSQYINHRILAMMVECGEFANELRSFKYWSNKAASPKPKLLDEYVDILFFWLSIGNTLQFTSKEIEEAYKKKYKENVERAKGEY